jgi:hypothetical protein
MKEANGNFHTFIEDIKVIKARPEISISEIPAPQKLAPYAFAITADLALDLDSQDDIATGRFVLLHDPE